MIDQVLPWRLFLSILPSEETLDIMGEQEK